MEDGRAGAPVQHGGSHQGGGRGTRHRYALVVDEEAAVGVAVERQAHVSAGRQDALSQSDQVLRLDGVGGMVREGAVELTEEDLELERQAVEDGRNDQSPHAVSGVGDHLQGRQGVAVNKGTNLLGVGAEARRPA